MRCLVEDMSLTAAFPGALKKEDSFYVPEEIRPKRPRPALDWWNFAWEEIVCWSDRVFSRSLDMRGGKREKLIAVEDQLPALGIDPSRMRRATAVPSLDNAGACLSLVSEPVVFTKSALKSARRAAEDMKNNCYRYSLDMLARSRRSADVRVSPSSVFVFCRSVHSSIASGEFSPPSVMRKMPEAEFARRCASGSTAWGELEPVAFGGKHERVYMQSLLPSLECLFEPAASANPGIAVTQLERIWVSTKGSASALHYDASHSVLLQLFGRKRMVFFHPVLLEKMGIYPLGHPLHRRARVDLLGDRCAANSRLFSDFWAALASEHGDYMPVEVVLEPGDSCTFPPGWAHYTESLDFSVSHTFRFTSA